MFEILPVNETGILAFKASGRLTNADYEAFLPTLEGIIRESGPISLYMELENFQGWEPKAAWDDLRFGVQHNWDFKRIAVVGEKALERAGIVLANFFIHADMRFFGKEDAQSAWQWLVENAPHQKPRESPQPYRKVLLATDLSPHSERAAQRAVEISGQYGAQLDVLHIVEEISFYTNIYDPTMGSVPLNEKQEKAAQERLQQFGERTKLGADAILNIERGYPNWSIVSWARENDVDLIVMGSHGRRGLKKLVGSVSRGVVHDAPCDVLIVRA